MRRRNRFLIVIFFLLLLLPLLDSIFGIQPVKEIFEKRQLHEKPALPQSLAQAKNYTRDLEAYFNDNYGFRKTFISVNSKILDEIFNESQDSRVVIGQEGWLYFNNYNSLLDALGREDVSDVLVAKGVEAFYRNYRELRAKNIEYLMVIAADKASIYPEFLPEYMHAQPPHRLDKFLVVMKKKHPDFPILDLRPLMLEAKEKEVIYHKTDTHWNRRGAHAGYLAIMQMLGIQPHPRSDFTDLESGMVRGDISDIMGIDDENIDYNLKPKFTLKAKQVVPWPKEVEHFHRPSTFYNENKELPVLFSYNDSFFGELEELVAEHFSKAYFINEIPCELNYKTIKNFRPNVVIQEFWEGRLEAVLEKCK